MQPVDDPRPAGRPGDPRRAADRHPLGRRGSGNREDRVQGFVSKLRKTLGATALETTGNSYRLVVPRSAIDAHRFHDLVTAARDLDGQERVASLGEALDLWRGSALSDVAYEPFAQAAIAALEEHRLAAREALIGAQLDTGLHAELVPQLEELIADNPYRERLREQLVLALYRAGRQADALEAYRQARETLIDSSAWNPDQSCGPCTNAS